MSAKHKSPKNMTGSDSQTHDFETAAPQADFVTLLKENFYLFVSDVASASASLWCQQLLTERWYSTPKDENVLVKLGFLCHTNK